MRLTAAIDAVRNGSTVEANLTALEDDRLQIHLPGGGGRSAQATFTVDPSDLLKAMVAIGISISGEDAPPDRPRALRPAVDAPQA